jgi:hypothetical protein
MTLEIYKWNLGRSFGFILFREYINPKLFAVQPSDHVVGWKKNHTSGPELVEYMIFFLDFDSFSLLYFDHSVGPINLPAPTIAFASFSSTLSYLTGHQFSSWEY